jgi:Zn-dependent protease/predicted transcriptional regulator
LTSGSRQSRFSLAFIGQLEVDMFRTRMVLFRFRGIPISIDASWLLILIFLTWTLTLWFREEIPRSSLGVSVGMGFVTALCFFVCIVLHELGHALVAQKIGINIRGITLFLFGGVAELEGEPTSAAGEFFMAIAGPAVSAALAVIFVILATLGFFAEWAPEVVAIFQRLFWINAVVLVFNLIPAFPLDGGRVLRSILWAAMRNLPQATYWASLLGQGFAWFLVALGMLQFVLGGFVGGMWMVLIGLFLRNAARMGYRHVLIRQVLEGEPVSHCMNRDPVAVTPSLDLRHFVDDYVYRYRHRMYPVVSDRHVQGVVTTKALRNFSQAEWRTHTVSEVMRHDIERLSVSPDADAYEVLERMQRTRAPQLLVVDNEALVGIVGPQELQRFVELKLGLQDREVDEFGPFDSSIDHDRKETETH